jgi:hypothetical protein
LSRRSSRPRRQPATRWDGSVDLYRDGVFTTQASWFCAHRRVQIVRNIVAGETITDGPPSSGT